MTSALYPKGVIPQDLCVGTPVRWYVSEKSISPYVGRVTHLVPSTNKVWVAWPIGYPTQHEPDELIIVPKEEGISPINVDFNGYSSYEKSQSERDFGSLQDALSATSVKMASSIAMQKTQESLLAERRNKIASKVASQFSGDIVQNIRTAATKMKSQGSNDLKAYNSIYSKYASYVSDEVIKEAILDTYES
jgi:hypothetical protein